MSYKTPKFPNLLIIYLCIRIRGHGKTLATALHHEQNKFLADLNAQYLTTQLCSRTLCLISSTNKKLCRTFVPWKRQGRFVLIEHTFSSQPPLCVYSRIVYSLFPWFIESGDWVVDVQQQLNLNQCKKNPGFKWKSQVIASNLKLCEKLRWRDSYLRMYIF